MATLNHTRQSFSLMERSSSVDLSVRFNDLNDVIAYLPRAIQIGLFAPFPSQWFQPSLSKSSAAMKLVAAFEVSFFYIFFIFSCLQFKWFIKKPEVIFIFFLSTLIILMQTYFILNIGSLYIMRFSFHILICTFGVIAFLKTMHDSFRFKKMKV